MKIKIHNHASAVVVYNGNEILTNIYDSTYPKEIFRNKLNLLGGGHDPKDHSPRELLERELGEEFKAKSTDHKEFDPRFSAVVGSGAGAPKISCFASTSDMDFVKNEILKRAAPYQDFLTEFQAYKNIQAFNIVFSIYGGEVSKEVMDCVKYNLREGKSLVCEGFLKITPLEDIISGKMGSAWATGHIIEDYFGIRIPEKEIARITPLGLPRETLKSYFDEFEYKVK